MGQQLYVTIFNRHVCVRIVWPVHMLEEVFGRMLCTSCICAMVVELTLATLWFSTFVGINLRTSSQTVRVGMTLLSRGGSIDMGGGCWATMGQVCFTAISPNRACPTVFIALSSV